MLIDEWEKGVILARNKTDEINEVFEDTKQGEMLFCFLAFACQTISMFDPIIRETIIESAHEFIDFTLNEEE